MKLPIFTRKSLLTTLALLSGAISVASFIAGFLGDQAAFGAGAIVLIVAIGVLYLSLRRGGTISAEEAAAQLEGQFAEFRVESIEKLFPNLPSNLSGQEVLLILGGLFDSCRVDAIRVLNSKIRKPLSSGELELILGGTFASYRTEAIDILNSDE